MGVQHMNFNGTKTEFGLVFDLKADFQMRTVVGLFRRSNSLLWHIRIFGPSELKTISPKQDFVSESKSRWQP